MMMMLTMIMLVCCGDSTDVNKATRCKDRATHSKAKALELDGKAKAKAKASCS